MKIVSQGYKTDDSFTILLIPESKSERDEFVNEKLTFSYTVNKVMGLVQIYIAGKQE